MNRDLAKTISFAVLHFVVGFTVSFALTGSFAIASAIAIIEPLANTVVFYFHERGWNWLDGRGRTHLAGWFPQNWLTQS
jgi:uncharacterized membrane protein